MNSSKFCLKHKLEKLISVFATSYPAGRTESPISEDNSAVLNFNQQRTTRQPNPVTLDSLSGGNSEESEKQDDDEKLEDAEDEIKKKKRKNIIEKLENEDFKEYSDSMNSPRDNPLSHGPGYGDPNFHSRSMNKLNHIFSKLFCTCETK